MKKIISSFLAVALLLSGIPLPYSYAAEISIDRNDQNNPLPVAPVGRVINSSLPTASIPSGSLASIQENPLSSAQPATVIKVGELTTLDQIQNGQVTTLWLSQQTEYEPGTLTPKISEREDVQKTWVSQIQTTWNKVHDDVYEWVNGDRTQLRLVQSTAHGGTVQIGYRSAPVVVLRSPALTNQSDYLFSYSVNGFVRKEHRTLAEGENTLEARVMGAAGEEYLNQFKVILDTKGPEVRLDSETPRLTNKRSLTVRYTADGIEKEKTFTDFVEGLNPCQIEESDELGNTSWNTFWVTADFTSPVIDLDPATPRFTKERVFTVQYTLDGAPVTKTFDNLVEGMNTLVIDERDRAGNRTIMNFWVTLDTEGPALVVDPKTPHLIGEKELFIRFTSDGKVLERKYGNLSEGKNDLTITEADEAGNESTIHWEVIVDTTPPVIKLDPGTPKVTNQKTLEIKYAADGVEKSQLVTDLVEGFNPVNITEADEVGNTISLGFTLVGDFTPPVLRLDLETPSLIRTSDLTVKYTVDGIPEEKTFSGLTSGVHKLTVSGKDAAGNEASLEFEVTVDVAGPAIVLDAANPTLVNRSFVVLNYTVDGVPVSRTFSGLKEGENTLWIEEVNAAGGVTRKEFRVIMDTQAPVITVDTATPALIHQKNLTVRYVVDGISKEIFFEGLEEGVNEKTISEKDAAGNESSVKIKITVDTIPPQIIIDPSTPALINQKNIEIHFTADGVPQTKIFEKLEEGINHLTLDATDSSGLSSTFPVTVTVDTQAPVILLDASTPKEIHQPAFTVRYTVDGVSRETTFSGLASGVNPLLIEARDEAGNSAALDFEVTVRLLGPALVLDPANPALIKTNFLTVKYTVDGVSKTKLFEGLADGVHDLPITETSPEGIVSSASHRVTVDTQAPVIVIDPSTPSLINQKNLTVHYTVDGVAKEQTFSDLSEGQNEKAVIETDLAGNESFELVKVTVDTIPPQIVLDAATPSVIYERTLTVRYTVDGETRSRVFDNLTEGDNKLTLEAVDLAGNPNSYSFRVTVDTTRPQIILDPSTPSLIKTNFLRVSYQFQGEVKSQLFEGLVEGLNRLELKETARSGEVIRYPFQLTVDTQAPVIVIDPSTPVLINQKKFTVRYTVDGAAKEQTFSDLSEGLNERPIIETDLAGNESFEPIIITVDTVPPVIAINAGTPSLINQKSLVVNFTADGKPESARFDNLDEGIQSLPIIATDEAGNTNSIKWPLTVDTLAPAGTLILDEGVDIAKSADVTAKLSASDAGSGVDQMRFSVDGGSTWTAWENFHSSRIVTLPSGEGVKEVRAELKDRAGNVSAPIVDTIRREIPVQILPAKNIEDQQAVRKTMILGPATDSAGKAIVYSYTPSLTLQLNGKFSLLKNQLTFTPSDTFVGTGSVAVTYAVDGLKFQQTLNLTVAAEQPQVPNDPDFKQQYSLSVMNVDRAWNLSTGAGVTIGVLDSGVYMSSPDLNNNVLASQGWDYWYGNSDVSDEYDATYADLIPYQHGTMITGLIAADHNDNQGITGVAYDAKVLPVKVIGFSDHPGWENWTDQDVYNHLAESIINGIQYAVNFGVRVISLSLAAPVAEVGAVLGEKIRNAIAAAQAAGVIIVAAAGNDRANANDVYPVNLPGVIGISATDRNDDRAYVSGFGYFSNYGESIDFSAPGEDIYSTYLSRYNTESGTSFSSPLVSGVVALILSQDPKATLSDVYRRLKFSAKDLGATGWDQYYGWGRVDAFRALSYDYYDNGIIKTQYLEKPDENGWNRLNFDSTGYLIGGSLVRLSGASAGLAGLAAEAAVNLLGVANPAKDVFPETYWIDRDVMSEDEAADGTDVMLVSKPILSSSKLKAARNTFQQRKSSPLSVKALMKDAQVTAETSTDDVSLSTDFYRSGLRPAANLGSRLARGF